MNSILFFAIVIAFSGCMNKTDSISPLPLYTDHWEIRVGEYGNNPIRIRINRGLDSIAEHNPLTYQAAASVSIKNPQENGLPGKNESVELKKIENILIEELVTSRLALYGLEIHTDKTCDFIFYTDNRKKVENTFKKIHAKLTDYEIDYTVKRDKKWITYKWFSSWE